MNVPSLVERVHAFLAAPPGGMSSLLKTNGIVAISGGPDSVALAALLKRLLDQGRLAGLRLAHLNHQLRGSDSDADEAFVVDLAKRWGLTVSCVRIDVGLRARDEGRNLEDTARAVRYAWLADLAQSVHADWIATGHTTDDQAETVLHHLLRGSGLSGLSGIGPCSSMAEGILLLRPLLAVRRQELRDYLTSEGIAFRNDLSNDDVRFTRNRLRHQLIPLLEREYNPALVAVLARTAIQSAECQSAVSGHALMLLGKAERPRAERLLVFSRTDLKDQAPFWLREMFREIWRRERWPMGQMTFDDWQRLAALAVGSLSRHDFPGGVHGRVAGHVLQLWREIFKPRP